MTEVLDLFEVPFDMPRSPLVFQNDDSITILFFVNQSFNAIHESRLGLQQKTCSSQCTLLLHSPGMSHKIVYEQWHLPPIFLSLF